jgi:hypothetical protein
VAGEYGSHENIAEREAVPMPSDKSFGITIGCALAIIGGIVFWRHGLTITATVLFGVAALFFAAAFLFASYLRPLNFLWLKFGLLLHKIVNPLILGFLFYVVFVPMGVVMRMAGVDFLRTRRKTKPESYWILRSDENLPEGSMRNQF